MGKRRRVRVSRDESFAEAFARLTVRQQQALNAVAAKHSAFLGVRLRLETAQAEVHRAVYDGLQRGVPARLIAAELGVSTSRVYQMRDLVAGFTPMEVSDQTG